MKSFSQKEEYVTVMKKGYQDQMYEEHQHHRVYTCELCSKDFRNADHLTLLAHRVHHLEEKVYEPDNRST